MVVGLSYFKENSLEARERDYIARIIASIENDEFFIINKEENNDCSDEQIVKMKLFGLRLIELQNRRFSDLQLFRKLIKMIHEGSDYVDWWNVNVAPNFIMPVDINELKKRLLCCFIAPNGEFRKFFLGFFVDSMFGGAKVVKALDSVKTSKTMALLYKALVEGDQERAINELLEVFYRVNEKNKKALYNVTFFSSPRDVFIAGKLTSDAKKYFYNTISFIIKNTPEFRRRIYANKSQPALCVDTARCEINSFK